MFPKNDAKSDLLIYSDTVKWEPNMMPKGSENILATTESRVRIGKKEIEYWEACRGRSLLPRTAVRKDGQSVRSAC